MSVTPARAQALADNLRSVLARVAAAAPPGNPPARHVAVSKYQPASSIAALHAAGHAHFGENYLQELLDKAGTLPATINWHFIGALQSNKARKLAAVPNLYAVESLDSAKKAALLNAGRAELLAADPAALRTRVFVQVNTSGEENKSGCAPEDALEVARFVKDECGALQLQGLMTIGDVARSKAAGIENEDFLKLREVAEKVGKELGVELELSMGKSTDYDPAIR
jgi:pyridoxal phosphate enzyme (YggS family)